MIRRVYIDTSVIGGYFDKEFDEPTKNYFKTLNSQNVTILVSEILELEIYKAHDHFVEQFDTITNMHWLPFT